MRKFKFPAILFSVFTLFLGVFLFTAPTASADCFPAQGSDAQIDLGGCLTLSDGTTVKDAYAKPADLINVITRNMFIVAGFILLILIIYSGFLFIAGGSKDAEKAKDVLTTALIGFAIMFVAFWVVRIIAIVTGADILF